MLSQNMSLSPKARDKRNAVSAVIARRPWTIALMRGSGTSSTLARRYWLIPMGSMNSVRSISPGWVGMKSAIALFLLVVVGQLDLLGTAVGRCEAKSPLVVDADAVLSLSAAVQLLG